MTVLRLTAATRPLATDPCAGAPGVELRARPGWPGTRGGRGSANVSVVTAGDPIEELFAAARGGRPEAWADLYSLMRPRLFRFARLRLATDDQAEDAVSETMARAIDAADRYRPGAGPAAWLVGICRNVVFEAYRAGGRTRSVDPEVLMRQGDPTPEPGPAERAVAVAEEGVLRAAFDRLGPDDQDVLALRVVAGLDAEEAAEVLGKRAGAVRMSQSRALARLRALMEEGS